MRSSSIDLIIDEEFKSLIAPLSADEYQQLEENIRRDGCRNPLVIWKGIILDGYHRYKICKEWNIPFSVRPLNVATRWEAMSWICANQLGRRNITEEMRKYLIGKRYEMEKMVLREKNKPIWEPNVIGKQSLPVSPESDSSPKEPGFRSKMKNPTAERIGEEYHIAHGTVEKYGRYSRAVDAIGEVTPELAPRILSGSLKVSHENLVALARLDKRNMQRYARQLQSDSQEPFVRYSDSRRQLTELSQPKVDVPEIRPGIKNMPEYNPDAEVISLTLTIPSWGSSIHRILTHSGIQNISNQAKGKLVIALSELQNAIEELLQAIKE